MTKGEKADRFLQLAEKEDIKIEAVCHLFKLNSDGPSNISFCGSPFIEHYYHKIKINPSWKFCPACGNKLCPKCCLIWLKSTEKP